MSDVDSWLDEATPHRASAVVCFDGQLEGEYEEALRRLREEGKGMLQPPPQLQAEVDELAERVAAKTHRFVFESLGRLKWRKLMSEHPATDDQEKTAGVELSFNPDSFPVAAMHACCSDPGLTEKQAQRLADDLSEASFDEVWAACLRANVGGGGAKKAVATVAAGATESTSTRR